MRTTRPLWVLFAGQAILDGGMALSFPFFAIYLNRERGIPMGLVGAALCASLLATSASQGFGGELSDILGRRRVMSWAMWLRAATVLLMAAAMLRGWPALVLMAVHVVSGFCGHFYEPASRGWLADNLGHGERSRAYGLLRIAKNMGWAVGPALGGVLAERSYPLMWLVTAAACAACAALITLGLTEAPGERGREAFEFSGVLRAADDRRFLRFCLFNVVIAAVMAQLVVSLSVHATRFVGLTERQVGALFSLNGAVVVLFQYPASLLWSRWPITSALSFGSLLYGAGYLAVGFAASFATMAAGVFVVSLGEIIVSPGLQALGANMAPSRLKGRYLGFLGLTQQVGSALGPLLGGLGLQFLSPSWPPAPWLAVGAAGVAAAAGFRSLRRVLKRHEEGLESPPEPLGLEAAF